MLSSPVFAKLQSGRSPDLSLRPRARSLPRLQNPIGFQTLALSPQSWAIPSSFLFNRLPAVAGFQTLFSPRRTTALNNPFRIMPFRTLSSPHRTTALNNPFGIKWFRTLSRHNGGIRVFAKNFVKESSQRLCSSLQNTETPHRNSFRIRTYRSGDSKEFETV
jgi:hypothetical protein